MVENDIFVKINDCELSEVLSYYKERAPRSRVPGLLVTAAKIKKQFPNQDIVQFFSPNNSWQEDGTLIIIVKLGECIHIHLFTLDDNCTNLYKGFMETNILTFNQQVEFYAIHEKFDPTIRKYLKNKNIPIQFEDPPGYFYSINAEKAKQFSIECPPEIRINKINSSVSNVINDSWPHKHPGSESLIAKLLQLNGGYGIFKKDAMIAWVIRNMCGNLTMLHSHEEYRRKGYAQLLVKVLSKEIAEEGINPFVTIVTTNQTSINLFEKLGFERLGICSFYEVKL